ncbi:hypothetical protein CMV30_09805 [Nibricoccus aquaticus]|uniref:Outer membrane protein beta-barrel domain-containing protein n=1 Tax=Nibricoccus aquaticus TaxID=2576891 RepID=A0A290Q7I1_9BACT|nr:outer membrane beta-barrel protein [Nibricoccus aquaticus]ATC64227.1 hypothetical protein CMV30_09805 [Nibricoccus aquaticus]
MKNTLLFLLSACAATVATAQTPTVSTPAATRFYVQPSLVLAIPGSDFDTAMGLGAAVGVSFKSRHSVELEYVQFETEPDAGYAPFDIDFTHILVTYKYRIPFTPKFSSYVGGSIGRVSQKISASQGFYIIGDDTDDSISVGLVGGVQYQFEDNIVFDGGLKVLGQDDTRFTTSGSVLLVQASVKFQF